MTETALATTRRGKSSEFLEGVGYVFRLVRTLVTLAVYAILAPWGYALFALMVALPTRDHRIRRRRLQTAIRTGFRTLHGWARFSRLLDVRTPEPSRVELPQPCILVANHPTHMDITAILTWVPNCCTFVKSSIYRFWWLKPLLEGSGQIEGTANRSLQAVGRLVDRSVERLRDGQSVVVFPEGTRTEPGRKMPFHRLAFEIACQAGVPVVPLRISCDPPYLSKTRSVFRPPRTAPVLAVEVLQPVLPEDFRGDSRRMRDRVRQLLADGGSGVE